MKLSDLRQIQCGRTTAALALMAVLLPALAVCVFADVTVDPSGRYYRDSNGKPVFLIGYYGWSATVDGYYIDQPSRYDSMISQGAPYKINYIRMVLGGNKVNATSNPPSADGRQAPVPWALVGGNANLNQWDPNFWNGVKAQAQFAKANGYIVHFAFFDGVGMRDQGGASYGYNGSFWNPANQTQAFYPAGDYRDCNGCFYRLNDFNNNTGIGYYQRALIDKACAELAPYDNVFFEVGNELLGSTCAWNSAVINYIKSKTNRPISVVGTDCAGIQGFSMHDAADLPALKAEIAAHVGRGYPVWEDTDGSQLGFADVETQRKGAWYSFASGAGAYGGFTCDFWTWPVSPPPGFNTTRGVYMKNLQDFITNTGIPFNTMIPQPTLVSNTGANCCLAATGSTYLAYILSDAGATVDLSAVSGNAYYKLYDPRAGTFSSQNVVPGGAARGFNRPGGASDWVIYVYTSLPSHGQLNVRTQGTITVDGNPNDWNLGNYSALSRAGRSESGDIALTGYDGGTCYHASYSGVLPTSAADHTATVYSAHDGSYEYFLARLDDSDIRYPNPTSANWQNDCVEIYLDPGNDGGSSAISNSTSDAQITIDANNQKNVYRATSGYTAQVLNGVTSGVSRDASGWWLEVRIAKNALSPTLPEAGTFGLDFNFRDNDNNNDPAQTTVYTWNDASGVGFPSKIPDNWGDAYQIAPTQQPYAGVINLPGVIQAENYDLGGEGVAYHDTDTTNSGASYRADGVDIEPTADTGGGYNVGWLDSGEWLSYTVNVSTTRSYDISMRVAGTGGTYHINLDGQNVSGSRNVTSTGGWQNWATQTVSGVQLTAGQHILTFCVDAGGFNLNYMQVSLPTVTWNTMGTVQNIGSGVCPCIAVDSGGNIHVAYIAGSGVQYKKYNTNWTLLTSEMINSPTGVAYWPGIAVDSNQTPHVIFTESVNPALPYAGYCYYTNRIGGSWKSPVMAVNAGSAGNSIWNPRLALWGSYAFIGSQYGYGGSLIGRIDRLTNLSGTPSVDRSINTATRSTIAINANGNVFAPGRNVLNSSCQEYDVNLNAVGGLQNFTIGTGKAGSPCMAWAGSNNNVHLIAWGILAGGSGGCADRCGMIYNNTARRNGDGSYPGPVTGLLAGAAGTGPDGTEPTGWWNDDVSPAIAESADHTVYVAWRGWTPAGEGRITKVDNSAFVQTCVTDPTCGGNKCTGTQFCSTITRRRWWNCEMAPAPSSGVYVAYEAGNTCYVQPVGVAVVVDSTPPANVMGVSINPQHAMNILSWTNPSDTDFTGVKIVWKTTGYPSSPTDGFQRYNGSATSYTHSGLNNGTTYYYKLFSHDAVPNYASGVQISGTPVVDTTPPGNVTNFVATPRDGEIALSWTNPSVSDLFGVKIMFKTTGYPSGPADGEQCFNGLATSVTHTGLTNGVTYYYKAYAYDEVPNYATGAQASTAPYNPQSPYNGVIAIPGIIQAENFDNGGEAFAYHDTSPGNSGGQYRSTDVDIETCSDTGGGYNISFIEAGEWLEYTINVASTGDYNIKTRVSNSGGSGSFNILIDGADATGTKTVYSTGGWQNWTTIIAPAVRLTAGQHILRLNLNGGLNVNWIQIDSVGADAVSIDLGSPDIEDGMTHIQVGDGDTVPWTVAGHNCRENVDYPDIYFYFGVSDAYAYQGNKTDIYITFDYYDLGSNILGLDYDSTTSPYQHVNGPTLTNTGTWKSYTFHVSNAYFGNRQNGGADFRFSVSGQQEWGIDTVCVYQGAPDTTPPGPATGLSATPGSDRVNLSWTNPSDGDFIGSMIRFKTTGYPTSQTDGSLVVDKNNTPGSTDSYAHTSLTAGITYYYKAFAHDGAPNYNTTSTGASAVPYHLIPVVVYSDTFDSGANGWNISLWQQGTVTPTMGWVAGAGCPGGAIQCVGAGYTDGTNAATREGGEMWKVISTASQGGYTNISNITVSFDVKVNGLGNNYSGVTGAGDHGLLEEQLTVSFSTNGGSTWTEAGYLNRTALAGLQTCAARSYDLSGFPACDNNANFALKFRWQLNTGPESPSGADIANIDNIVIRGIASDTTPPGNVTGFTATSGDNQITLAWTKPGDADLAGVKIMFKTTGYPTGQADGTQCYNGMGVSSVHTGLTNGVTYYYKAFTYDVVPNYSSGVQASAVPADVTAPGAVTNLVAYGGSGQNTLRWTSPGDADLAGIKVVFKTTGYPTGPNDGTQCYNSNGSSYTHTGLTNGVTYYYKAFAFDEVPNYSAAISATASSCVDESIGRAKLLTDNQIRALRGKVVSNSRNGYFYVQEPSKTCGIKVISLDIVAPGDVVDVIGAMRGADTERFIDCSLNRVKIISHGNSAPDPVALSNAAIGGSDLSAIAPGVLDATGPNNLGLLIVTWGKVTQRDTVTNNYFYIDDGSHLRDGTYTAGVPNIGVFVAADPTGYPEECYVVVTGISACFTWANDHQRQILPIPGGIRKVFP